MNDNRTIKEELTAARHGSECWHPILPKPSTKLRLQLLQFAVEADLEDEREALIVIAARYFRMAESDRFGTWFNETAP